MTNDFDIASALQDLEKLSQVEYHASIVSVVDDPDRLRRLAGIMIKRSFATPKPIETQHTLTQASQYWSWDMSKLASPDDPASPEYQLLLDLRDHFSYGEGLAGLESLTGHAESERGLFKIVAGWLHDKIRGQETQSLRQYYGVEESKRSTALLDLADMLANFALTPLYVALFASGGFAIPILLLAAKHGYAAVFDSANVGDAEG